MIISSSLELKWEWPADRKIEQHLLIKVDEIKAQSSRFLSISNSPSFAASIQDPTLVCGKIESQDKRINQKSFRVVASRLEIEFLSVGDYVMIGIVDKNICVSIRPLDSGTPEVPSFD